MPTICILTKSLINLLKCSNYFISDPSLCFPGLSYSASPPKVSSFSLVFPFSSKFNKFLKQKVFPITNIWNRSKPCSGHQIQTCASILDSLCLFIPSFSMADVHFRRALRRRKLSDEANWLVKLVWINCLFSRFKKPNHPSSLSSSTVPYSITFFNNFFKKN